MERPSKSPDEYRQRAEARIRRKVNIPANPTREEFQRLVHDLEVHQIELEMQNDELRGSQTVLEQSRHEYSDLYDFSPIGYFSFDAAGRILRVNLTGAGQLGLERHLVITKPFDLYVAHADQGRFREHLRSVFETRTRQGCDLRVKKKPDGSNTRGARPTERSITLFDARMESIFVNAPDLGASCRTAVMDVTLRKRAEDALRDSEERYRSLVEGVKDYAIVMLDVVGRISSWNAGAEEIHGYRTDEILGRPVSCISTADGVAAENPQRLLDITERERTVTRQGWLMRKDGSRFWGDFVLTALHDQSGRLSGFSMITRDLTDRKRAEEEILKVSKLESIGVLAGGIAHDFNNLLMAINGNLYLAKSAADPAAPSFHQLAEAERACVRAARLTQQLLTFSRGGAPIKQRIRIGALLEDWATFGLRGSNVHCEFSLPKDLWFVEADEGQMSQVINNLVINAQQAMPNGGTIRIRGENFDGGRRGGLPGNGERSVRIYVEDEGVGIPEENLSKIFDPFFTTKSTGSGLGLTTSHAIIQKHGGELTVESRPGRGATFCIDLPASATQSPVDADPATELTIARRGKGRILLMDDEEALRTMIADLLPSLGYEVECVPGGTEAVDRYRKAFVEGRSFDAVILDLTVPGGMGGKEAAANLRRMDPQVRMVVSSGYSQDAVLANFQEYGFAATLIKPFQVEDLQRVLLQVMNPGEASSPP